MTTSTSTPSLASAKRDACRSILNLQCDTDEQVDFIAGMMQMVAMQLSYGVVSNRALSAHEIKMSCDGLVDIKTKVDAMVATQKEEKEKKEKKEEKGEDAHENKRKREGEEGGEVESAF